MRQCQSHDGIDLSEELLSTLHISYMSLKVVYDSPSTAEG